MKLNGFLTCPQEFLLVPMYLWLYSPCGQWLLFQFFNPYTVGRTPWVEDEPIAMILYLSIPSIRLYIIPFAPNRKCNYFTVTSQDLHNLFSFLSNIMIITKFTEFSTSGEAGQLCSYSRFPQQFMEPGGSSPRSVALARSVQSIPSHPISTTSIYFNIIHPPTS
jgi:hypothetical protein